MTTKKLIVVIGATGGQGGSVVNSFINDPEWRVRGITRNPQSRKAKNLEARGVEVVQADLDDRASLAKAFQNANVIFAVSDFWGIYNDPKNRNKPKPGQALNEWTKVQETQQLKNIIDEAARVSSLERFIMSSLPGPTKLSGGKYTNVCHHDSKADAEEYGEQNQPELWAKTNVYLPGYFLNNFLTHPMAQPTKVRFQQLSKSNDIQTDAVAERERKHTIRKQPRPRYQSSSDITRPRFWSVRQSPNSKPSREKRRRISCLDHTTGIRTNFQ